MIADRTGGEFFENLFASIDAMDTESFLSFIHEDATFRFGSAVPVKGHAAIGAAVEGFFASFAKLRHVLKRQVAEGNAVVCEGEVTYTRHDGSIITLPFANVFEVDDGLISLYRIYIDIGPLYAA
ncbi:MAG: nuclear transport factor 2 family protein [Gammaproteobacteria bacterium]|nr:nuclear transport factor 2 family protein [Gammaproteobacteria bacterium]MDH3749121.1 nuclear transport factor 2 family protein [Gammaproteobacteria bacterium]MDH3804966.1 nuclear transport factor 2 family protein [Gammaproteobacteria bacterium]